MPCICCFAHTSYECAPVHMPLQIRPPDGITASEMHAGGRVPNAGEKHGLVYCRGAEVVEVKDEAGK